MATDSTYSPVTLGFAGDVMIGRQVNEMISEAGYSYPWGDVLPLFKKTDLNLINLEAPLTHYNKEQKRKANNLKADPSKIQTLINARIDVVNIANNHILDFYEEGLMETIDLLDKSDIKHVGAGVDVDQAAKPVIISKNGINIGILGFTDNEPYWKAWGKPGTNYVEVGDIKPVRTAVKAIRDQVDILILSIHWGNKMVEKPLQEFVDFAHQIIDEGVDIIHGHGAHIFQGIEIYKDKLIMYDIGDLIDDYPIDNDLKNNRSFLLLCEIMKNNIKSVKLIPVILNEMQVNIAKNGDYESTITHMQQLSAPFGTFINANGEIILSKS